MRGHFLSILRLGALRDAGLLCACAVVLIAYICRLPTRSSLCVCHAGMSTSSFARAGSFSSKASAAAEIPGPSDDLAFADKRTSALGREGQVGAPLGCKASDRMDAGCHASNTHEVSPSRAFGGTPASYITETGSPEKCAQTKFAVCRAKDDDPDNDASLVHTLTSQPGPTTVSCKAPTSALEVDHEQYSPGSRNGRVSRSEDPRALKDNDGDHIDALCLDTEEDSQRSNSSQARRASHTRSEESMPDIEVPSETFRVKPMQVAPRRLSVSPINALSKEKNIDSVPLYADTSSTKFRASIQTPAVSSMGYDNRENSSISSTLNFCGTPQGNHANFLLDGSALRRGDSSPRPAPRDSNEYDSDGSLSQHRTLGSRTKGESLDRLTIPSPILALQKARNATSPTEVSRLQKPTTAVRRNVSPAKAWAIDNLGESMLGWANKSSLKQVSPVLTPSASDESKDEYYVQDGMPQIEPSDFRECGSVKEDRQDSVSVGRPSFSRELSERSVTLTTDRMPSPHALKKMNSFKSSSKRLMTGFFGQVRMSMTFPLFRAGACLDDFFASSILAYIGPDGSYGLLFCSLALFRPDASSDLLLSCSHPLLRLDRSQGLLLSCSIALIRFVRSRLILTKSKRSSISDMSIRN